MAGDVSWIDLLGAALGGGATVDASLISHLGVWGPQLTRYTGRGIVLAKEISWQTVTLKLFSASILLRPSVWRRRLRPLMRAQGCDLSRKGVILALWKSFFQFQMSNFGGSDWCCAKWQKSTSVPTVLCRLTAN